MLRNIIMKNILFIIAIILVWFFIFDLYYNKVIYPNKLNEEYIAALEGKQIETLNKLEEESNKTRVEKKIPTTDSERARVYVGEYIGCINRKEYNIAYDYLNEEFKRANFNTLEDFINYCNVTYDVFRQIEILQYKRVDKIIIVEAKIPKLIKQNDGFDEMIQYFTIMEKDKLGNFEISFGMGEIE